MSDNTRLSSTQALEDYFVDLLLEPELEPELEADAGSETAESVDTGAEPEAEASPEVPNGDVSSEEGPRPGCHLPQDAGLDEEQQPLATVQLAEKAMPAAKPFDFGSMDEDAQLSVSSMPSPMLDRVQRLLNQVNKVSPQDQTAISQAQSSTIDSELEDDWQQVMAHEQASATGGRQDLDQPKDDSNDDHAELLKVAPEAPEPEHEQDQDLAAENELETKTSEVLPPNNWSQQIHQGDEFQALFFEVNGVTFAVPLTELGGIHQLGDVNRLLGRPPWYLGLMSSREHQLDVVDTACWVMPDKLDGEEYREQYKYVVVLGESSWGLACNTLLGTETLSEHSVRWREKAGKRPWLAGMVKEKMCALIHVSELISMLKAGLDVNTKLRQS
ncbi:chemotaxis protein CheW [Photobacterium rosenbergii]|uniref:Chemotaxis protein CheW n=1 Tax=Photobacterium rosenbergii TaxID=294936 RepID=A0A2T3NBI6_9GAMM|nr:chemotaxis protein CheW [Photobacterium rosenbergii]PSW11172.1 chemotaxis protein CheW [Photobacterium rosenbergii]